VTRRVALEWAADHAAALEADAGRLYVGGLGTGAALAAAAALQARDRCWPAVAGQVLIQPDFHAYDGPGLDRSSRDVAPATVIVFGRGPEIRDGLRYAARLREASVDVRVLHHDRLAHVVDDLALALRDVRVAA